MIKVTLSRTLGELRMSQRELSRMTGIRASTINDLYNDMLDRVNLDYLDRICKALNCELEGVIKFVPDPPQKSSDQG